MCAKKTAAKSQKEQPTKMGRPRSYTPESLEVKFEEYKEHTANNPFIRQVASKHGPMDIEVRRPMSIIGFCVFAKIDRSTLADYENNEDYSAITARVRDEIAADQIEGAMAGVYDSNIASRVLKLADRTDVTTNGKSIQQAAPISVVLDADAAKVIKSIGKGSLLPG